MSFHHYTSRKCCAGDLCNNENLQILLDHIFTKCGKSLNLLCRIGVQEKDTFVFQLYHNYNILTIVTQREANSAESEKRSILPWNQILIQNLPHTYFHKLWQFKH